VCVCVPNGFLTGKNESLEVSDGRDLELSMERVHTAGSGAQVGNSLGEDDQGDQEGGGGVTQQAGSV